MRFTKTRVLLVALAAPVAMIAATTWITSHGE
jgi:hypothetical protein